MSSFREVQLKGYEILNAVVNLCEKHKITYYLSSGTLLGAIRHDGFIPWDNDIDIEMPICDYRKFLRIAKKELPQGLFLQTYYTDPGYNEMWAKVRVDGTTSLPVAWKKMNIHWGIGIDIFPLVGVYQNTFFRKWQIKLHSLCRAMLSKDFLIATESGETLSAKHKLIMLIPRWLRIACCLLLERVIFRNPQKELSVSMVFSEINYVVNRNAYEGSMMKVFETREFQIPRDYDHILKCLYGDYMTPPPESERNGHEGSLGKIIYDCERSYKDYIDEI